MNDTSSASAFRAGYAAIVGRPNVGKSTLTNRLVGHKVSIVSRKQQTTRHRVHGILTTDRAQFVFVDTPGFQTRHKRALNRLMNRTVTQALSEVDVIVFVIEACRFTAEDAQVMDLLPEHVPVVLVMPLALFGVFLIYLPFSRMSLMRLPIFATGSQLYCRPPTRTMSPPCW